MHWKSKNKIQRKTTKLYLTELKENENLAHEIRLQLGKKEYVLIDLKANFPQKIEYRSLNNNGFNYTLGLGDKIIIHHKDNAIEILQHSKNHKLINSETVDKVIDLINGM
ncbi:hypothetical protein M2T78_01430 [Elizabethkingia ursingii]|uniref:hypothetical protein n=1 Tax=Elizabethkingia ursingii TaxID=1756150 RepID=UPI002011D8D5|nr:hypothetical protein [Elizabethkingia ursingii]MCL1662894.1 hypothetical protein [Elizabethkingia ursingii]